MRPLFCVPILTSVDKSNSAAITRTSTRLTFPDRQMFSHYRASRGLRRLPREDDPVTYLCDSPQLAVDFIAVTDHRVAIQPGEDRRSSVAPQDHSPRPVSDSVLDVLGHLVTIAEGELFLGT